MTHKEFLTEKVPQILKNLTADTEPSFGLMTAQHMVEHLTWITKVSLKRHGEPVSPPTKGQLGFKRFIEKGAHFEHRPSNKTKADLPALKYNSLEEAIEELPKAVARFYNHFAENPDYKSYNQFQGELNFEELELFHTQHYKYHFNQFGLI